MLSCETSGLLYVYVYLVELVELAGIHKNFLVISQLHLRPPCCPCDTLMVGWF